MAFKSLAAAFLIGASLLPAAGAVAQITTVQSAPVANATRPMTAADLEGLRTELRSSRKQTMASTLKLTDAEATRFWPIYDQYAADLTKIKDSQYELIAEYANTYGKYDDKAAHDFISRWVDLDVKTSALRARYVPLVERVLPGVKAATFFQIDRSISMAIDLKINASLPLLQTQMAAR